MARSYRLTVREVLKRIEHALDKANVQYQCVRGTGGYVKPNQPDLMVCVGNNFYVGLKVRSERKELTEEEERCIMEGVYVPVGCVEAALDAVEVGRQVFGLDKAES